MLFFFKRKAAYELRISVWSSDVCSSDLSSECRTVIGFEPLRIGQQSDVTLYDLDRLVADCPADVAAAEQRAEALTRDDLACIIYPSGTGGAPRGVLQHHGDRKSVV